jgi:hypothetical protein
MDEANRPHKTPNRSAGPAIDGVLAYWQEQRRGRVVPARTDMDPTALQPWLPCSGIIERSISGQIRFRLAGQVVCALMGMDARGLPLRTIFAPEVRARVHAMANAVFDGPQALRMALASRAPTADGQVIAVRLAMLPLTDSAGAVTRALICIERDEGIELDRYCRFHVREATLTPLTETTTLVPQSGPDVPPTPPRPNTPVRGDNGPAPRPARPLQRLRVIMGGRV